MKKLGFLVAVCCIALMSQPAVAQKFGYVNSTEVLASLPEVKQADSEMDGFQKILQKQGQKMVEDLQTKYAAWEKKQKSGEVAPKILEEEANQIKADEQKIQEFETSMRQQVQEKRETLLKPILDKVNKAINDVAKEKGYQYVFDSSTGVLLYADESVDVSKDVKAKLGIN